MYVNTRLLTTIILSRNFFFVWKYHIQCLVQRLNFRHKPIQWLWNIYTMLKRKTNNTKENTHEWQKLTSDNLNCQAKIAILFHFYFILIQKCQRIVLLPQFVWLFSASCTQYTKWHAFSIRINKNHRSSRSEILKFSSSYLLCLVFRKK